MLKFKCLARASLMLLFFIAVQSAFAQCIDGPTTVCGGSQHSYTIDPADLPAGTANTIWSITNGTLTPPTNMTGTDVTWGAQGAGKVVAAFFKSLGQSAGACTLDVQILPLPEVTLLPDFLLACVDGKVSEGQGYCENQDVPFSATGGGTYVWTAQGSATVPPTNGPNAVVHFTSPGTATVCVTVTSANGCVTQLCKSYVVYARPQAGFSILSHPNATTQVDICRNESLTFLGNYSDPNTFPIGGTYSWLAFEAGNPGNVIGGGNQQSFTQQFEQPGDYVVVLTVTNCMGCSDEHSILVHVNPFAGPEITCPSVVCQSNEPVLYCAPDAPGCTSPIWSIVGGTFQQSASSPNCIEVIWNNPPASGYGTVTLSCSNALCPIPTTVELPIIPPAPVIQGPTLICDNQLDGNTYTLPYWPGTEYTWSVNPGLPQVIGSYNPQTPNIFSVDLNGFNGTFTVSAALSNVIAGCTANSTLDVTVQDYNIVTDPVGPYCFGFPNGSPTFTIVPTPMPAGFQIRWTISGPNSTWNTLEPVDDAVLDNLNFQTVFGAAGDFDVRAEIIFGNNAQTCDGLSTQVTIDPPVPPITDVTGRQSICPGQTYSYTANPAVNGATYEWQATGGTVLNPTNRTTQVAWANTGPYSLQVRRVVNGCYSDWYPLTITPLILPDVDFDGPLTVCTDVPYTYTANDLNLDQYTWTAFGGSIISGQGTPEVQVIWYQSSTTERLRLRGSLCNLNNEETKNITLIGQDAAIEGPSTICQYINGTYSVVQPDPGATYTWFVDNNQLPQTGPSVTLQFQYVGQVTIRVRIENYMGCPGVVGLEFPVEVTPNPKQFITQSGFLNCNKKGSVVLTTSVPANNPGSTFNWYHLEGGPVPSFVPVANSVFSNFYTPNGASLTIQYHPNFPGSIGTFRVVINEGSSCPSEAFYTVQCIPYDIDPNPSPNVVFTNWDFRLQSNQTQQIDDCGMVFVEGTVSPTCLTNSFFFVLNGGNGLGFNNPVQVADIFNPSALIGPFTAPGVYQVALVGEYDCDGHGPNPPLYYADIREITIPLTTNFVPRVTCVQGQPGTFTIDLLNTTDYLPQFNGNINWTWTTGGPPPAGTVISNEQNTSFTANAGQTVTVCLTASTQVPGDENPPIIHDYECTLCQDVVVPADLTVGIGGDPSSFCSGSVGTFQALVADPSQVISYDWTFVLPSLTIFHSTVPNPTFGFPSGGDYTLTLEVLFANGCRATATRTFSITQNNISINLTVASAPCGARQITACNDPSCMGFSFLWSTAETTPSIIVSQSGYYSVTVTDPVTGCSSVRGTNALASSPFNGSYYGTLSQCKGEDILELFVPVTPGFIYTFSGLGLPSTTLNAIASTPPFWNVPLGNVNFLPANNYPFTVTVTDNTGNACNATLTGTLVVHQLPAEPTFTATYFCDPFRAVLQANQPVSWYQNSAFISFGSQITVFGGGSYSAVTANQFGCTSQFNRIISGPPEVDILTGCYCIEPEVIQNGLAVLSAPGGGPYNYWAWFQAGNLSPLLACTTAVCGNVQPLVLQAGWEGDITLFVKKEYTNSDGSKTTCSVTSDIFCWEIGPCEPDTPTCIVPEATTRTIACIEDYGTYQQYHIHWDFVDNGTTHPCNFPQNLPITGAFPGNFVMIDHSLINGYWHFEGIFNLYTTGEPIPEPFDICWEIPFCLNSTGQQCGVAQVCPKKDNPQHNDDVILGCYENDLPYCDDINFSATIACDNDPINGVTHIVNLNLSVTIPATLNTIKCPKFSFYINSVTGTIASPGYIRVDLPNVPPVNGQHVITATIPINWYDQIGIDYACFQVILAHYDRCWPTDGNICSKRFCFDASGLNCDFDQSPYRFSAVCSPNQGGLGVLYNYTLEFLNQYNVQQCTAQNTNPNGQNTVTGIIGFNKISGQYLSYTGNLNFDDVFTVNGNAQYHVQSTLPACSGGDGGGRGGDGRSQMPQPRIATIDANLRLMPNPTTGRVMLQYSLAENSVADEHDLVVVNALGVVQHRFGLSQFGVSNTIPYDASALPNGVYQVCLLHRKQTVSVQRMVVLKDR